MSLAVFLRHRSRCVTDGNPVPCNGERGDQPWCGGGYLRLSGGNYPAPTSGDVVIAAEASMILLKEFCVQPGSADFYRGDCIYGDCSLFLAAFPRSQRRDQILRSWTSKKSPPMRRKFYAILPFMPIIGVLLFDGKPFSIGFP